MRENVSLNCRFKFSLGFNMLMARFMAAGQAKKGGPQGGHLYPCYRDTIPRGVPLTCPQTPTNEFFVPQDDWSLVRKYL